KESQIKIAINGIAHQTNWRESCCNCLDVASSRTDLEKKASAIYASEEIDDKMHNNAICLL
ncbi:MAG: hypothetical protein RSD04_04310, partial [Clostridia bacterium]